MEISAHFTGIRSLILKKIEAAESEILIAVAWFTNQDMFELLLSKLSQRDPKISVSLIIINDDINFKSIGLNFQEFIDLGGHFYLSSYENPMHNKYCIIDKKVVITGSYNYTYFAESINEENIITIKGDDKIVDQYRTNFQSLISGKEKINSLEEYLRSHPVKSSMLSRTMRYLDVDQQIRDFTVKDKIQLIPKLNEYLTTLQDRLVFKDFEINRVQYRQWKQDYFVDKVVVKEGKLILTFRTISSVGSWIYGPEATNSWFIRDSDSKEWYANVAAIRNVKINGKLMAENLNKHSIYFCRKNNTDFNRTTAPGYRKQSERILIDKHGNQTAVELILIPDHYELSCELEFDTDASHFTKIDLIEGRDMDQNTNHWHCFAINLKLNQQKLKINT